MIHDSLAPEPTLEDGFKTRLLLIDDEQAIRRYLRVVLQAEQFEVYEATTANAGLRQVENNDPEIILLDLQLPDDSGVHLIRSIHAIKRIPILILSEQEEVERKIAALDAGAEDYIIKPFNTGELLARIRVALRRERAVNMLDVFSSDYLEIDFVHRLVTVDGQPVDLTLTEYELLRFLVVHANQPVTHRQLWQAVRSDEDAFDAHTIRVHLSNLRRKLEADPTRPQHILTEVGIGYRFKTEAAHV